MAVILVVMIGRYTKGRTMVFIDAGNIWYAQKTLGWRIDYKKLQAYLQAECLLQGIRFYTGAFRHDLHQQKFLQKLDRLGYMLITKEVKKIETAPGMYTWKSNLDIELALDAMEYRNSFDTFILFSGDSDFAPLIDRLKSYKKWVIVFSTKRHVAHELKRGARFFDIKKFKSLFTL